MDSNSDRSSDDSLEDWKGPRDRTNSIEQDASRLIEVSGLHSHEYKQHRSVPFTGTVGKDLVEELAEQKEIEIY